MGWQIKIWAQFIEGIPYVPYFLDKSGFGECLALIGAGVAFLMVRKVVTLFSGDLKWLFIFMKVCPVQVKVTKPAQCIFSQRSGMVAPL